ncbi:uncharacterized protein LOC110851532 isoform X2 [Folsomia candida]|uniref:uncharacterized protein LOC110851532 isoform X2 n=1 Tax=Folsomia candida TaxID=158441 RepID=UPI001604B469|nr:uncharacterized protein LOC110851532 isoform X2 [Folsomia candida]
MGLKRPTSLEIKMNSEHVRRSEKQEAVPFLIGILMNRWNALHKAYIDDIDIEDFLEHPNLAFILQQWREVKVLRSQIMKFAADLKELDDAYVIPNYQDPHTIPPYQTIAESLGKLDTLLD